MSEEEKLYTTAIADACMILHNALFTDRHLQQSDCVFIVGRDFYRAMKNKNTSWVRDDPWTGELFLLDVPVKTDKHTDGWNVKLYKEVKRK